MSIPCNVENHSQMNCLRAEHIAWTGSIGSVWVFNFLEQQVEQNNDATQTQIIRQKLGDIAETFQGQGDQSKT